MYEFIIIIQALLFLLATSILYYTITTFILPESSIGSLFRSKHIFHFVNGIPLNRQEKAYFYG